MSDRVTAYVSIGNSDDQLSQEDWSEFCRSVDGAIDEYTEVVHGRWYSLPNTPFQNACWCVEIDPQWYLIIRGALRTLAERYGQWGIAWAEVEKTDFLGANG